MLEIYELDKELLLLIELEELGEEGELKEELMYIGEKEQGED